MRQQDAWRRVLEAERAQHVLRVGPGCDYTTVASAVTAAVAAGATALVPWRLQVYPGADWTGYVETAGIIIEFVPNDRADITNTLHVTEHVREVSLKNTGDVLGESRIELEVMRANGVIERFGDPYGAGTEQGDALRSRGGGTNMDCPRDPWHMLDPNCNSTVCLVVDDAPNQDAWQITAWAGDAAVGMGGLSGLGYIESVGGYPITWACIGHDATDYTSKMSILTAHLLKYGGEIASHTLTHGALNSTHSPEPAASSVARAKRETIGNKAVLEGWFSPAYQRVVSSIHAGSDAEYIDPATEAGAWLRYSYMCHRSNGYGGWLWGSLPILNRYGHESEVWLNKPGTGTFDQQVAYVQDLIAQLAVSKGVFCMISMHSLVANNSTAATGTRVGVARALIDALIANRATIQPITWSRAVSALWPYRANKAVNGHFSWPATGNAIYDPARVYAGGTGAALTYCNRPYFTTAITDATYLTVHEETETPHRDVLNMVGGSVSGVARLTRVPAVAGTGYTVNDVLTLTTGGTGATAIVTAISGGGATGPVSAVRLLTAGIGYAAGASAVSGGTGADCQLTIYQIMCAELCYRAVHVGGGEDLQIEFDHMISANVPILKVQINYMGNAYDNPVPDFDNSTLNTFAEWTVTPGAGAYARFRVQSKVPRDKRLAHIRIINTVPSAGAYIDDLFIGAA